MPTAKTAIPIVNTPITATLPVTQIAAPTAIASPIIQPAAAIETPAVVGPVCCIP